MILDNNKIAKHNVNLEAKHDKRFAYLRAILEDEGIDVEVVIKKLQQFQVAIPSWALGTGGTRFGRFPSGGEPGSIEEKIEDVGVLHALNGSSGAISLHIPWDIPKDPEKIKASLKNYAIRLVDKTNGQDYSTKHMLDLFYDNAVESQKDGYYLPENLDTQLIEDLIEADLTTEAEK